MRETKVKHTAGPWLYQESTKTIRSAKENYWLATMDSWDGAVDNEANARLIASAPDLLAALKELRKDINTALLYKWMNNTIAENMDKTIEDAITQAEAQL